MADVKWTISLRQSGDSSDTDVVATGMLGGYRTTTRGSSQEYVFDFTTDHPDASLTPRVRYETVRQLLEFPTNASHGLDNDHVPWYKEAVPSVAPVDSHVVRLAPDPSIETLSTTGVWALVTGGEDLNTHGSRLRLSLSAIVLAHEGDYADRSAVQDAFAAEIVQQF